LALLEQQAIDSFKAVRTIPGTDADQGHLPVPWAGSVCVGCHLPNLLWLRKDDSSRLRGIGRAPPTSERRDRRYEGDHEDHPQDCDCVRMVHFIRNALALVPKSATQLVAATIRTVFAQPDAASAREQWRRVADNFRSRFPRLAGLLDEAEADVLAYLTFPQAHWRQIWSNNPLERLNKEVKRRTDVVGIFPNGAAVLRLVGMILAEQHDEWQVSKRYFSAESLARLTGVAAEEAMLALPLTSSGTGQLG
jgi:putative transposase